MRKRLGISLSLIMAHFLGGCTTTVQKVLNALFGFIIILSSIYSWVLNRLRPEITLLGLILPSIRKPVVVIFWEKHFYFYFKYNQCFQIDMTLLSALSSQTNALLSLKSIPKICRSYSEEKALDPEIVSLLQKWPKHFVTSNSFRYSFSDFRILSLLTSSRFLVLNNPRAHLAQPKAHLHSVSNNSRIWSRILPFKRIERVQKEIECGCSFYRSDKSSRCFIKARL